MTIMWQAPSMCALNVTEVRLHTPPTPPTPLLCPANNKVLKKIRCEQECSLEAPLGTIQIRYLINYFPKKLGSERKCCSHWTRHSLDTQGRGTPPLAHGKPPPLWDTDACARPVPFSTKQKCKAKVKEKSSSVTCDRRLSLQYKQPQRE